MLERSERVLRIICLGLVALIVVQISIRTFRTDPLKRLTIPALPSLPANTNAPAGGKGPNSISLPPTEMKMTNLVAAQGARPATNAVTNSVPDKGATKPGTNVVAAQVPGMAGNTPAPRRIPPRMAMNGFPGQQPGGIPNDVPPAIRTRIERITDSEILGPVIRPMPMAVLGIAGNSVFLRAPNGQTGLVKEGDELGGVKLLQIGINRILVEDNGQKKELTLFSGFGSESLMPK